MDNNIYNILVEDSPESEKLVVTMVEQCRLAEEHKINKNQEISYNSIIKKNVPVIKMDSCASRNMSGSDGRLTRLRRLSESRKIVITGFNGSESTVLHEGLNEDNKTEYYVPAMPKDLVLLCANEYAQDGAVILLPEWRSHACHMQKTLFPGTYWVHAGCGCV